MSDKETINPSDEGRTVNAFKYWYETNTEKGVTSIPDYICKGLLDLYNKEKEKNEKLKTLLYQIRSELRYKVIIKEDGIYKPCKNLTKQQVYESYVKLNLMLKANYVFKNNEKAIEELLKEGD